MKILLIKYRGNDYKLYYKIVEETDYSFTNVINVFNGEDYPLAKKEYDRIVEESKKDFEDQIIESIEI